MQRKLINAIASHIAAWHRCFDADNETWIDKHSNMIRSLDDFLPSGSGFDSGSHICISDSTGENVVITTDYHHVNEHGCYSGWSSHVIRITASLYLGINLDIESDYSGVDSDVYVDDHDDYIAETFDYILSQGVRYDTGHECYKLAD